MTPLGLSSPNIRGPLPAKVVIIFSKAKVYLRYNSNPVYSFIPVCTGDCSLTSSQTCTNAAPHTDCELSLIVHVYIFQVSFRLESSPNGKICL